jgi:hypothetical protein
LGADIFIRFRDSVLDLKPEIFTVARDSEVDLYHGPEALDQMYCARSGFEDLHFGAIVAQGQGGERGQTPRTPDQFFHDVRLAPRMLGWTAASKEPAQPIAGAANSLMKLWM